MLTAVQLRDDATAICRVLHGTPCKTVPGTAGPIALFEPNQRVLFLIQQGRRQQAFLFRTGEGGGQRIAGVHPEVSVLLTAATTGRVAKLRNALLYLNRAGACLDQLQEDFFVRLNALLEGNRITLGQVKRMVSHAKQ